MRRYLRLWPAVVLSLVAPRLAAQLAPVGAPKGTLRFEIGGRFESADRRLFDGRGQTYLADFGSPALGSDRLPFLRTTDSILGAILGQPGYRVNLGGMVANGQRTVGTGIIGVALGVTRRLTLFTRVPLVTARVQANLRLDSTSADAGFNPAHPTLGNGTDQALAAQFLNDFSAALTTLDAQIAGGAYAGNPALDQLAREISTRGAAMRDGFTTLTVDPLSASPFLPTQTGAAGLALLAAVRGLQDTLATQLGVSGFSGDPVLAVSRLSPDDFAGFVADPAGPIAALPIAEAKISRIGDMDIGASYTAVDRFDRPGRPGGFRFAAEASLRLPTGQRDDPNNLTDLGTGNGRYELGLTGTADLGRGLIGSRFTGGYRLRFSTLRVRRVSPPSQPYAPLAGLTNVREKAGDVIQLGARPFLRLASNLALHGVIDYWHEAKGSAEYPRAIDSIPGVPARVLAQHSARSAWVLGGGITYVGRAARECEPGRRCGLPIEASWNYSLVTSASGGRVPQSRTTSLEIRWYQRLWR